MMPPFEHSGVMSLDKILQEEPRDSLSGTTPVCHITMHVMKSPKPSSSNSAYFKCMIKVWRREQPGNKAKQICEAYRRSGKFRC